MFDEYRFPFEIKEAEDALARAEIPEVAPYYEIDGKQVPCYIIFYDLVTDRFYGISAKRYLEHKYDGLKKVNAAYLETLYIQIRDRIGEDDMNELPRLNLEPVKVFGLDDYHRRHPDDGFALYREYIADIFDEIGYMATYIEHPYIRYLTMDGFGSYVHMMIRNDMVAQAPAIDESKTIAREIFGVPEVLIDYITRGIANLEWHSDLIKMVQSGRMDAAEVVRLLDDEYVEEWELTGLMKNEEYEQTELLAYLERCQIYQGLPASRTIRYLNDCAKAKEYYVKSEPYPVSLKKEAHKASMIEDKFLMAQKKTQAAQLKADMIADKEKYIYQNHQYMIEPVCDLKAVSDIKEMSECKNKTRFNNKTGQWDFFCLVKEKKTGHLLDVISFSEYQKNESIYIETKMTVVNRMLRRFLIDAQKYYTQIISSCLN